MAESRERNQVSEKLDFSTGAGRASVRGRECLFITRPKSPRARQIDDDHRATPFRFGAHLRRGDRRPPPAPTRPPPALKAHRRRAADDEIIGVHVFRADLFGV
ncbi:hypothetical protein EVAR_27777_1 [Eumeta japonica]|uniref:Uncharacterized protein n=1 Tax=Eumeta variegata TaxID=151549 RepID=A0A4C1VAV9_EUMVA|nr:hypothetical protein EVAR_27777_1 [Eumeta japonica]